MRLLKAPPRVRDSIEPHERVRRGRRFEASLPHQTRLGRADARPLEAAIGPAERVRCGKVASQREEARVPPAIVAMTGAARVEARCVGSVNALAAVAIDHHLGAGRRRAREEGAQQQDASATRSHLTRLPSISLVQVDSPVFAAAYPWIVPSTPSPWIDAACNRSIGPARLVGWPSGLASDLDHGAAKFSHPRWRARPP